MNKIMINSAMFTNVVQREVYRNLRTNIVFTGTENRSIMITSCEPGDGKSTVSFGLSNTFAQAGKKTIYIDADMRKSAMAQKHKIAGIRHGLSSYLSGQVVATSITYATNVENLYYIPCGVFPTNPTELLGNDRFEKLIKALKNNFEYVIIDTPPLGSVIDAAIIATKCDGCILVISDNKTTKRQTKQVVDQLKRADANLLGAVLNKAETALGRYGYYSKNSYYYASANEE